MSYSDKSDEKAANKGQKNEESGNTVGGEPRTQGNGHESPEGARCKGPSEEEEEIEKLAVRALLEEAKRGRSRYEQAGAMGWRKRKATLNKRFLGSVVTSAVTSNKRRRLEGGKATGHPTDEKHPKQ